MGVTALYLGKANGGSLILGQVKGPWSSGLGKGQDAKMASEPG